MSEPIITKQMLIDKGACLDQVALFEQTFGDSVIVTIKRAEKVAHLFDWSWGSHLLDATARAEYQRVTAPALAEYQRVIATALAEYERVTATAWAEYQCMTAAARAEYERVTATARAEYQRVTAPAWALAFIDMHKRGAQSA